MEEHLQHGRSFPGCMKGLVHFLDLHHHLQLRKMKMLTYSRHGEGKRAARNKGPKTDPDAPSTSQQYVCTEDAISVMEDKISTRKHPVKSSMKTFIPKWRLREHNKKGKVSQPASKLLRTSSIHHRSENHVDNVNSVIETSVEQNEDGNKATSSNARVYILPTTFEKQFDEHTACQIQLDELASFVQRDTNAKELQGDVILHPSKEFIAMMKLFNGNIELIQNILDDPSFIFAHYLQVQQDSFPAPGQLERKNDGLFRNKHTGFESESFVKQSEKFHSENSPSHSDITEDDAPKTEMEDGEEERTPKLIETNTHSDLVASSSILQNARNNPPSSNQFMIIKQRIKDVIKDNKKEHHRISMDGILHKIPYGRKVLDELDREGSIHHASLNKSYKCIKKNIKRSQSLNDSLHKYSCLYEAISKEEFKRLPERSKLVEEVVDPSMYKMNVKTLGRIFSLPNIKYYSPSKNIRGEAPLRPSSPTDLTTAHTEERLEQENSKEFATEVSSKWMLIDCGKIPLLSNEQEQSDSCQISNNLTKEGLIREGSNAISPQGQELSTTKSFALDDVSPGFLDYGVSEGLEHKYPTSLVDINTLEDGLETNEIDLARAKPSPNTDCFDSLHLQIDQKDIVKFNYVREILKRSGFSGNDFLGAWHSPYQPKDPYELDIVEDEHDILLEHQLLFDLINEVLVEICKNFFGYLFPWLSSFNTNIKPVPTENHILEEVWTNICWHLKGQPQLDITVNDIVAPHFTKNDEWMNIQYDIEDVELEVECLIMDDLLDDVVLQLFVLPGSQGNP